MKIVQNLKYWRERAGMTQQDVAHILNTSRPQYARYEAGTRELPLHHVVALAKFYGISLDTLVGMDDD